MGQYSGVYTARQQMQAVGASTWPATTFDYLIVAGGGGGAVDQGGGGGGGGVVSGSLSYAGSSFTITVGAAGAAGSGFRAAGSDGGLSRITTSANVQYTATGGGGGGPIGSNGRAGGSGGGGGAQWDLGVYGLGGAGTSGQGFAGGRGTIGSSTSGGGGGGGAGGIGEAGGTDAANDGGDGGDGVASSITGSSLFYGGGGGGGTYQGTSAGTGGSGVGGNGMGPGTSGSPTSINNGVANRGGGGGGGFGNANQTPGAGGSGVVVIRSFLAASATTGSPTVTTANGLNVYTFTGSGTINFPDPSLGTATNPAPSVAALRAAGTTTDGAYYFTMGGNTFRSYVRFNYIDGGDWYLILKVHNQGDMPSGSAYWQNATLYNENDFNLTSGTWSKYASWLYVPFTRVMMGMTQGGTIKVPPIMIWNSQKTSFYNVISGITPSNGSGDRCDSTSPSIGTNATYWNMSMASGGAFTDANGQEDIVQHYGIGCFNNNASNSTTAEGFPSVGRAGAWVGCPLDEGGHTFNNVGNSGSDSGFGFGASTGNPAKTTSCGYSEWTNSTSTNTLPAYLWVR